MANLYTEQCGNSKDLIFSDQKCLQSIFLLYFHICCKAQEGKARLPPGQSNDFKWPGEPAELRERNQQAGARRQGGKQGIRKPGVRGNENHTQRVGKVKVGGI